MLKKSQYSSLTDEDVLNMAMRRKVKESIFKSAMNKFRNPGQIKAEPKAILEEKTLDSRDTSQLPVKGSIATPMSGSSSLGRISGAISKAVKKKLRENKLSQPRSVSLLKTNSCENTSQRMKVLSVPKRPHDRGLKSEITYRQQRAEDHRVKNLSSVPKLRKDQKQLQEDYMNLLLKT